MKFGRLLALGAIAIAVVSTAEAQQNKQLSIATGGTGGVYYPLGGGFGNILGKELPGVTATAQVTGGSVANLQLIGSGKADICFTQVDAAWDAINGLDKFASGKLPISALAVMYANYMHVVSVEGTGITKVEDMKGHRVSTGSPGSATEVFALRVIEAAGLDKDKDMKRERLGVAEFGQRHQGQEDRRLLLRGRPADLVDHGFGGHAQHQDQDDRPRPVPRQDDRQVRQHLRRGRHPEGDLRGHGG